MKRGFRIWTFILATLCTPLIEWALDSHEVIERKPAGLINWTAGWVSAKGSSGPDEKGLDPSQARKSALAASTRAAKSNLLQLIKGIRIDSNTTVGDILVASETIKSKLDEILTALTPTEPIAHFADGTASVTLQMPFNNAFAKLILPADIKQIEPVKQMSPIKPEGDASPRNSNITPGSHRSEPTIHTGMIVDAKGLSEVRPALVPKIVDESGQEVYGPAFVSREYAIQSGMSGFTRTLDSAKKDSRVKDNPLIVKGLKTKNLDRSVIVISNSDAGKLRKASEHLSFLRQCGVIIVLD